MSRDVVEDLEELVRFVSNYGLSRPKPGTPFRQLLSSQHRAYIGLLTLFAEVEFQLAEAKKRRRASSITLEPTQVAYLRESASDLGSAMFCWIHGAYKPSRFMVRSSIENFVKGLTCAEVPRILTARSVYTVFRLAKAAPVFQGLSAENLGRLNNYYSQLSWDVHTATVHQMINISALRQFPCFQKGRATSSAKMFRDVVQNFLIVGCRTWRSLVHSMHHRNKQIVMEAVPSAIRAELHTENA